MYEFRKGDFSKSIGEFGRRILLKVETIPFSLSFFTFTCTFSLRIRVASWGGLKKSSVRLTLFVLASNLRMKECRYLVKRRSPGAELNESRYIRFN